MRIAISLRDNEGFSDLQYFEKALANIALKCTFSYGGMGRVGFLYESAKDQLRWGRLSVKQHIGTVLKIGQVLALTEENYKKEKVKAMRMSESSLADALIAAFGDGK